MMRNYKMLFTALFLAAFIAGCGGGNGEEVAETPAATTTTTTTTSTTTDATDTTAGITGTATGTTSAAVDTTAPTVSSTDPVNAATDVAIDKKISATFDEEMDSLTVTTTNFLVTGPGTTSVSGTLALVGNIATFTPGSNLAANTLFTVTVTTGAKDIAGNALASDNVSTFTTGATADLTAPTVSSTNPANADGSVAINKKVTATFSESMDSATIITANYTVTGPGATPVAGTLALVGNVATFTSDSNFAPSTLFTATITTGAKDAAGNALASDKVWTFTTGTEAAQSVAQATVPLGSSSNFAILASAAITNVATSVINGDVGLTPDAGSNISGFSAPDTCPEVTGKIYAVDATGPACIIPAQQNPTLLSDAKTDAGIAFTNARNAVRGTPASISGNLNGLTLYPGLYESGTSLEISAGGFLYLDAQGDANAVFVIRSETSITTLSTSEVVLTKGAKAANVYWIAGSSVTLGANSIMKGTFVAGTSIALQTGANLEGRALNQGASAEAVTLDSSTITVPSL
ncbi:MAG: ice-binding family protein [Deltaproteobacteria bacterium]|nr:ice-binding family protein [Deltaproteobacteria bacterium]